MPSDEVFFTPAWFGQPEPWEIAAPRKLSHDGSKSWVPPGQEVTVSGRTIDGMVYVGSDLGPIAKWNPSFEPALILPDAEVATGEPDVEGVHVRFHKTYAQMHPESRAAYLDWLAAGRPQGAAAPYVLLFVYGLERRILHDARTDETAKAEIPVLLREIERLAESYPDFSFWYDFLPKLQIAVRISNGEPFDPDLILGLIEYGDWELPALLRIVLGQFVAQRKPIPAEWALSWYYFHPDTRLRVAIERCPEAYDQLFAVIYRDHFGDGLTVKMPKNVLDGYYHYPSSPSFGGGIFVSASKIPDVSRLKKPVEQINEIAALTLARLDLYSRAIGSGWPPGSAAAMALYPSELATIDQAPAVAKLKRMLDKILGRQTISHLAVDQLLKHFPEYAQPPTAAQLRSLGNLLYRIGFGLEPNPATSRAEFNASTAAVLFRVDFSEPASERDLSQLIALVDLGRHVAMERGATVNDGLDDLIAFLALQFDLSPNDVTRLRAHLTWAHDQPVSLNRLRKPLRSLSPKETQAVAPHFFAVGPANAPMGNSEISLFGKVYATLGLDQQRLHSDLHASSTSRSSSNRHPSSAAHALADALDREQVHAVRKETDEVAHMLHDVFGAASEPDIASTPRAPTFDIYAAILTFLSTRPAWPIVDLRALTDLVALPLAGTIETLNDRAVALGLEPLLECDDEICDVSTPTIAILLAPV